MGRVGNIVFGLIVTDFISTYKVDYKTEYRDWGGGSLQLDDCSAKI